MIQDRGRIKWTSLYLPEHKKLIAEMYAEQYDQVKPVIDEQRMEEIQEVSMAAIQEGRSVLVTYYENKRFRRAIGKISKADQLTGIIYFDSDGRSLRIPATNIMNMELAE